MRRIDLGERDEIDIDALDLRKENRVHIREA
jgi:hypothetical protein